MKMTQVFRCFNMYMTLKPTVCVCVKTAAYTASSTASNRTVTPQDGSHAKRRMGLNREQMEAMNRVSLPGAGAGVNGEGPQRPTQLSLAPPAPHSGSTSAATSPSPTPSTPADSGPRATSIGMPLHFFASAFCETTY